MQSIYEMLMPKEYIEMVENRQFEKGEGNFTSQGSDLHFVKNPDCEGYGKKCRKSVSRHCRNIPKGRQGRRRSRKPLALPCWASITQHGTNMKNTSNYKAFCLVHIIAQNAQRSDYHSRHTSVDVSINNQ